MLTCKHSLQLAMKMVMSSVCIPLQDAAAAAELLGAVLALDHQALPHLPAVWPLVSAAAADDSTAGAL